MVSGSQGVANELTNFSVLFVGRSSTAEEAEGRGRLETGETSSRRFKKSGLALLILIVAVFVAARFWNLTSYGLFGDEVFTLWTVEQDWNSMFASVIGDVVHPPLFYVMLKLWIAAGGESLFWLKLLPALLSIASLVPFTLLARELEMKPAALGLAAWLAAVNGFVINHAQELRMYSLLVLLGTSSLWLFAKLFNRAGGTRGVRVALCIVNLLLVYTHYFGWILVILELMILAVWKRDRLRSFAADAIFLALCFSPWVYLVAGAARDNPSRVRFIWNQPPRLSEVVGFYANLSGPLSYRWKVFGTAMVMTVFLLPIVFWFVRFVRAREPGSEATARFLMLALFAFGPVAIAFLGSHLLPESIWAYRYLIIAAPPYFLAVSAAAHAMPGRRIKTTLVMLIAGWAGLSGFTQMSEPDRVAWKPLVTKMIEAERDPGPGIRIYVTDANVGNTIQFYLDQAGDARFEVSAVDSLEALEDEHWWVGVIRYRHETSPLPQERLKEFGFRVGDSIEAEASGHTALLFPVWKGR